MGLKQEQLTDIEWARKVLEGSGDEHDSRSHAEWMLDKLSTQGIDDEVRGLAAGAMSAIEGSRA